MPAPCNPSAKPSRRVRRRQPRTSMAMAPAATPPTRSSGGSICASAAYLSRNARPKKRITRPTRAMALTPENQATMGLGARGGGGGDGGSDGGGGSGGISGAASAAMVGDPIGSRTIAAGAASGTTIRAASGMTSAAAGAASGTTPAPKRASRRATTASSRATRSSIGQFAVEEPGSDPGLTPLWPGSDPGLAVGAAFCVDLTMTPASQPMKPRVTAPSLPHTRPPTTAPTTRPIHIMVRPPSGNQGQTWAWPGPGPGFVFLSPFAAHGLDHILKCFRCRGPGRHGGRGLEADARPNAAAEGLGHRRAAAPAEVASPQSLQRERHDRHRRALDDATDAAAKRIELACIGDAPLRKDAHQLALLQRARDLVVRGVEQRLVLLGGRDRDRLAGSEHEREHRDLEDAVVHHGADRARARG